jgi:serine/threonine-protein kinase
LDRTSADILPESSGSAFVGPMWAALCNFMLGKVVGKYRIVGHLGRGAMGTVFRAVDETLAREVAIKILNPELADPRFMQRFQREATTLARLNHPAIATIYELFRSGSDVLMVMEYVRGETLETISARVGTLEPARAAYVVDKLLSALGYAHRAGIVHCDIKPANVMVTEHGGVKIMDFGVARVRGAAHLSPDGYIVGTPAYMAPEQVLLQPVDLRADLYSVGVVLYRLLTGALPFHAQTATAMVRKQLSEAPTPLHVHREGLPEWCDAIVTRALAKPPSDRFQTAEEFREALARVTGLLTTELSMGLSALAEVARGSRDSAAPTPMSINVASNADNLTLALGGRSFAFAGALGGLLLVNVLLIAIVTLTRPALRQIATTVRPAIDASMQIVSAAPAAASIPAEAPPPPPIVARTFTPPFVFDSKALTPEGKRQRMRDAKVVLADGRVSVQAKDNSVMYTVPYEEVVSISYSQGRDPMWNSPEGPARVTRADGGLFGVFRLGRHWVSLCIDDERGEFLPLLFSTEAAAKNAIAAIEKRTGRSAELVLDRKDRN